MARNKSGKFGAADGFNFEDEYNDIPEKKVEENSPSNLSYEKRSKQIGIVVTPSTHDALKELKYKNIIKSTNDLVNDLLEAFIKENLYKL